MKAIRKFVNDFQRIQNPVPSSPYLCPVNVVGYNTVTIFNNTVTPIAWANESNYIGSFQSKVVYRGNQKEVCMGILNIFLGEKIVGFDAPEATVVKKKYI